MVQDDLEWLMEWYAAQCDGAWEEEAFVQLGAIPDPGWKLEIALKGSKLAGVVLEAEFHDEPGNARAWHYASSDGKTFVACGGLRERKTILARFRAWAESHA